MRPACTIDAALSDSQLLGAGLGGNLTSWEVWRCVLSAAFANGLLWNLINVLTAAYLLTRQHRLVPA